MMGQPCTTLQQRWSACREGVWCIGPLWRVMHPWPKRIPDCRPCSSPRRHGCRNGQHGWQDPFAYATTRNGEWRSCEEMGVYWSSYWAISFGQPLVLGRLSVEP